MSGFEKQTYTQTPNSLFEAMKDMDECELKVVLYICRMTFGYHRDEIKVSTRKIAEAIGMNTASVDKGADAAVARGLVERVVDGNKTTLWRALVSDSISESPAIQKLNRHDSDNESLLGVKESNKEKITVIAANAAKPDLVDGIIKYALGPKDIQRAISRFFYLTPNWDGNKFNRQWMQWAIQEGVTPEQIETAARVWQTKFNIPPNLKMIQEHWLSLREAQRVAPDRPELKPFVPVEENYVPNPFKVKK